MRIAAVMVVMMMLAGAAGCSLSADDGDDAPVRFDCDVQVDPGVVRVWFRYPVPHCTPELEFPRLGECIVYGDVYACDGPETCIPEVSVEGGGVVLGPTAGMAQRASSVAIMAPGMLDVPDAELVINGCGSTARIPLQALSIAAPTITELTTNGLTVNVGLAATDATSGIYAFEESGGAALACQGNAALPLSLPAAFSPSSLWLASVTPPVMVAIPWGTAYVWNISPGTDELTMITPRPPYAGDDVWSIADPAPPAASVIVNGLSVDVSRWGVRLASDGHVLDRIGGDSAFVGFDYDAGEVTDELHVTFADGRYVGSFPHVVPADDIDFAFDGDLTFRLDVGPVVLTSETDPSMTRTVSFSAAWDHSVIARIVP